MQQASLKSDDVLKPGDTIRTGRNGRVLLVRGEESILIAPNSVVGLPAEKKEGLSTTIIQKAGSILLEVEKKNVKHFEVETPYLAAVVKGTQFRVTVSANGTSVDVIQRPGRGRRLQVRPDRPGDARPARHRVRARQCRPFARRIRHLQPIEHGKPRASSVDRVPVPRSGLRRPASPARRRSRRTGMAAPAPQHGVTRISSSLGEVKLNVHKVTHGLARSQATATGSERASAQ